MMKKVFALLFSIFFCSHIFAGEIKQIIILGDSLSDNGNLYQKIFKVLPKSPPYYEGRFSNGPTWAEGVSKYYYNKSYIASTNYAIGGATAIVHNPFTDSFVAPVTIPAELYGSYYADPKSWFSDKSSVLYAIWIGANDYLYERSEDTETLTTNVVNTITWTINDLIQKKAKYFVVMNLPDMGKTPYAIESNLTERLHAVAVLHNKKLAEAINQLRSAHPDVKFVYIDIYSIFNDLIANTAKYNQLYNQNLKVLNKACWSGGMLLKGANQSAAINAELKKAALNSKMTLSKNFDTQDVANTITSSPSLAEAYRTSKLAQAGVMPCGNANEYVFWDHIHPTATVHEILAQIVEREIDGAGLSI